MNNIAAFVVWVPYFFFIFLSSTGLGGLGLARFPSFGWKINIETKQRCGSVPATRFQPVTIGLQFFVFWLSQLSYIISNIYCGKYFDYLWWLVSNHSLVHWFMLPFLRCFNLGYRQHACLYLELIIHIMCSSRLKYFHIFVFPPLLFFIPFKQLIPPVSPLLPSPLINY